jgi:hypothetical protein
MRQFSCAVLVAVLASCRAEAPITEAGRVPQVTAAIEDSRNPNNPMLFPKESHPYGANINTWADREAAWVYSIPFAQNPLLDRTGENCGVDQSGPVWFIPRIAGPRVFSGTRTCTIPPHTALLLEIGSYINEYPCPDPNFRPAPGQSLYDFLRVDAKAFMDGVTRLDVSLDGQPLDDVLSYRFASEDLYYFTGDPTMAAVDPCITGSRQPAIVDGFFMMFKPLDPGTHVLRVFGTDVRGANKTYVYNLTVQ